MVAAQMMLMVEAGELALDDFAADHLPADLQFDTLQATIRQLPGHRSGLPDYYEVGPLENVDTDVRRVWTPAELLELAPTDRLPPGRTFAYAETNYLLLKLVIEHRRGRQLADVLRNGALAIDGLERLVAQPDETPTEPMAMPAGEPHAGLDVRGGYLPSLADATAYNASGGSHPTLLLWRGGGGRSAAARSSHKRLSPRCRGSSRRHTSAATALVCVQPRRGVCHSVREHRTVSRLHVVGRVPAGG